MSRVKVLYCRNLTASVTEESLRETFERFGRVERVKKIKDYAFVHFEEREQAVEGLLLDNYSHHIGIRSCFALKIKQSPPIIPDIIPGGFSESCHYIGCVLVPPPHSGQSRALGCIIMLYSSAMNALNLEDLLGAKLEISLAKPPSDKKKKEEMLRKREQRMMQAMAES